MQDSNWLLGDLRVSIDRLDQAILTLLSERFRVIQKVMELKKTFEIDYQKSIARNQDIQYLQTFAADMHLGKEFVESLFKMLLDESMNIAQGSLRDTDYSVIELDLNSLQGSLKHVELSLLLVLAERFSVVKSIGKLKAEKGLPALDQKRWESLMEQKRDQARDLNLPMVFVERLFTKIHSEALRLEEAENKKEKYA
ncbi:MAG: chorismate mutase [SAR324 cluster bacterium]|nr:chorismate mutase [SAR324 cluster bacterium]